MTDTFTNHRRSPRDPAHSAAGITSEDAIDQDQVTTAFIVTTPGTVRVTMADGGLVNLTLVAGQTVAVRARRVWQTGTTATGIVGLS